MRDFAAFIICVGLLVVLGSLPAPATPTMYGYSGLFIAPTADVLPPNNFSVEMATMDKEDFDLEYWSITVGARNNVEAGFVKFQPGPPVQERTVLHAKVALKPGGNGKPAVAAGIFDPTDELDSTVYVVASQETTRPLGTAKGKSAVLYRAHAGFGGGFIDGFFFGAEVSIGDKLDLIGEWVNSDFNAGGRFHFTKDFTADVFFQNMDTLALGGSYTGRF